MKQPKLAYTALTVALMLPTVYLYAKGLHLKSESFGLGLSYIIPAVICLGLVIVSGCMALLEAAGGKQVEHDIHV